MVEFVHFKDVLAKLEYQKEMELLALLARRVESVIAGRGRIYRYRYDEFGVLLSDDAFSFSAPNIPVLCEKLITAINRPIELDGNNYFVSVNIGTAIYDGKRQSRASWMQRPKIALKSLRQAGKVNDYRSFSDELQKDHHRALRIQELLPKAIKNEEFDIVYQPKICAYSRRVLGAEALLRWSSEELGEIAPSEFIPIAEASGFLIEIGDWVLCKAIQDTQRWVHYDPGFRLSINVSAIQLEDPEFPVRVFNLLDKNNFSARNIELEITESLFMQDFEKNLILFNLFSHFGIELSLDDFGTGYSSLSYLHQLPFKSLKIDKSFIRRIEFSDKDQRVVGAIARLGKEMGKCIVIEGVETKGQLHALSQMPVDQFQGFYFSHPLEALAFEEKLSQNKVATCKACDINEECNIQ